MALIFHDTFTESGGGTTTLASHVPSPVGTSWTRESASTAGRNLRVVNTTDTVQADGSGAGTTIYRASPAPTGAEYDLSFPLAALETSNNPYSIGMYARWTDSSNYYFCRILPSAQANDKTIWKRVATIHTQLGSAGDQANAVSDVITFEIRNATKRLLVNGAQLCTSTDNVLTSAGEVGLIWGSIAGDSTISTWEITEFQVNTAVATAYTLAVDPGVYAVTGSDATLALTPVYADISQLALYGAPGGIYGDVTHPAGATAYTLAVDPGVYAVTGSDAGLVLTPVLADISQLALYGATGGIYGDVTKPSGAFTLAADPGAYSVSGSAATLIKGTAGAFTLAADPGAYTITGSAAGLLWAHRLVADPGSLLITGSTAGLARGRLIIADAGVYAVTGATATFARTRRLTADPGVLIITGSVANLTGPAPVFIEVTRATLRGVSGQVVHVGPLRGGVLVGPSMPVLVGGPDGGPGG